MRQQKRIKRVNIGTKIICETVQKKQRESLTNNVNKKKNRKVSNQEKIPSKEKEDNTMDRHQQSIFQVEEIAFDFEIKNKCYKMVDHILSQNQEQITQSQYIQEPFKVLDSIQNEGFSSTTEDVIFQVYLHQASNQSNPSSSLGFISSVIIPDLKEVELFLRQELEDYKSEVKSQYYSVNYLCPIHLSYNELLSIYNFNTGFYKDFLQEGNQIFSYMFDHFLQSKTSIKFLQVLLTQKYSEIDAKKVYNTEFQQLENIQISNKIKEAEELNSAKDIINFSLIEGFNSQKRKEKIEEHLNFTQIFQKFSEDSEMIKEIQEDSQPALIQDIILDDLLDQAKILKEVPIIDNLEKGNMSKREENLNEDIKQNSQLEQLKSNNQQENQRKTISQNSDSDIPDLVKRFFDEPIDENINDFSYTKLIDIHEKEQLLKKQKLETNQTNSLDDIYKSSDNETINLSKQFSEIEKSSQENSTQETQSKPRVKLDGNNFQETQLLKNIQQVLQNPQFQKIYKSNLFRHSFMNNDLHQIIEVFDPSKTTMDEFIKSMSFHTGMTYETVRQKLTLKNEITMTDLQTDTLYDCIYSLSEKYLKDSAQLFFIIRKHFVSSQDKQTQQQINELQQQPISLNTAQNQNQSNSNQNKWYQNSNSILEYHQFNRRNPLVLCKKAHHLKNFDFINELHIKNNKGVIQSIVTREFTDNKINVLLLPLEHFQQHILNTQTINLLLQSSSIFALIKDVMIVRDFASNMFLENQINPELLLESFSQISYSKTKNLELLEVIGDVVIKYLSSLFLYIHLPNKSENTYTQMRTIFINNKFLGIAAFRNCLQFYVQTKKPNSYDWRFNLFNLNSFTDVQLETKQGQASLLTHSNLSDVLESVMGTIYVSNNFTLQACIEFTRILGLRFDKNLQNQCSNQVKGSFVLSDEILNCLKIEEDMTYYELYLQSKNILKKQMEQNEISSYFEIDNLLKNLAQEGFQVEKEENVVFMWNLINFYIKNQLSFYNKYEIEYENNTNPNQRRKDRAEYRKYKQLHNQTLTMLLESFENIINYTFKDKSLLIKALNCHQNSNFVQYAQDYQILEFLGDAIIEILVVSNGYHISRNRQNKINTPYFFCEMKSLLLSNDFMSRMAILNKYHYYALNISRYQQDEILQFIEDCDLNTKFKEPVVHQANSPKILGDLWESVAGAIIMDSDIWTFASIYGRLYVPYILHFVTFYSKIIFNVKEKVQLVAQQTYEQLGKVTEVVKDTDGIYKVKVTILIKKIVVGFGIDLQETLAEKKAFQDAYNNIFIKKESKLGLIFQGREV